jgi:predicted Zn-dependent protease
LQFQRTAGELYTLIGAHAEAEKWYRKLMERAPNGYVLVVQSLLAQQKHQEAIELCKRLSQDKQTPETATLLANVMTATHEPVEKHPEVKATIAAALKKHSENVSLLQAEAVRQASQGQFDGAIAMFQRILAVDPENVLALNNLATMFAERSHQRAEALQYIERAIEIGGRQPALLDTQGTIFLKIDDAEKAIASLEEATIGGASDARFYLHLAAAYHRAQRPADAARMLTEARALALEKFVLTEDDRQILAMLDKDLNPLLQPAFAP